MKIKSKMRSGATRALSFLIKEVAGEKYTRYLFAANFQLEDLEQIKKLWNYLAPESYPIA